MLLQPAINQQSLADFRALNMCGLAGWASACNPRHVQPAPRNRSCECTRLRTPSPYGQLKCFSLGLPGFFARNTLILRVFVEMSMCYNSVLQRVANLSSVSSNEEIGEQRCQSSYTSPRLVSVQPLPVVEKQEQTKPCLVEQRVLVWPSLLMLIRSKVLSLAQQEIFFTVKPTQISAAEKCNVSRQQLSVFSLRDVKSHQFVLWFPQWTKTALFRGSYYETSDQHFCSFSNFADRCMYEARRRIHPRRNFAVRTADRRVTMLRLRAISKQENASIVPLTWGGFCVVRSPSSPAILKRTSHVQ